MKYQLSKDLETGNALIDSQHRTLIDNLNNLLSACAEGKGRAEVEATANFLMNYIETHFADEEALQREHGYPGYQEHKAMHDKLRPAAERIMQRLKTEGVHIGIVAEVNAVLGNWLLDHIKREDKKVAEYIRKRQEG